MAKLHPSSKRTATSARTNPKTNTAQPPAPVERTTAPNCKRKRTEEYDISLDTAAAHDIFRRHFERAFAPLPKQQPPKGGQVELVNNDEGDLLSEESDEDENDTDTDNDSDNNNENQASHDEEAFRGLSDDDKISVDTPPVVEVVDHSGPAETVAAMTKHTLRSFMVYPSLPFSRLFLVPSSTSMLPLTHYTPSARPPSPTSSSRKPTAPPAKRIKSTDPEDSVEFLANDIALQRLISESHLLLRESASTHPIFSASLATHVAPVPQHKLRADSNYNPALFRSGKARLKATDMRLRALGAAGESLYARPKSGRSVGIVKRMAAAEREREDRRRKEAKESGIVLERKGGKSGSLVGMDKRRRG